ncbi:PIF1-like helicase-domain-containing protein [Blyttiomyces helicus]|uniref:ATP-dependent DNA helicase n=1 Tax=Blyttiomyces helicus TaxID=388810 RepID=A0A4P9WGP2_9FUNG|nr:PIF1-like helicase-domain-containing protein [Blyttiomyces helicus]|eukprot:RKO89666.1 PIF1-like helicase-domain-containing protein [Blyttiomyces helicus]
MTQQTGNMPSSVRRSILFITSVSFLRVPRPRSATFFLQDLPASTVAVITLDMGRTLWATALARHLWEGGKPVIGDVIKLVGLVKAHSVNDFTSDQLQGSSLHLLLSLLLARSDDDGLSNGRNSETSNTPRSTLNPSNVPLRVGTPPAHTPPLLHSRLHRQNDRRASAGDGALVVVTLTTRTHFARTSTLCNHLARASSLAMNCVPLRGLWTRFPPAIARLHSRILPLRQYGTKASAFVDQPLAETAAAEVPKAEEPKFVPTDEQKRVLQLIEEEKNVHENSALDHRAVDSGRAHCRRHRDDGFRPFLRTGIAATSLPSGGRTIHSWAGIGLGDKPVNYYVKIFMNREMNRKRSRVPSSDWINVDVLFIDEISMMSKGMFDKLSELGKEVRDKYDVGDSDAPFGGVRIITCGDFFQLPPVPKDDKVDCPKCKQRINPRNPSRTPSAHCSPLEQNCFRYHHPTAAYAFQSAAWAACRFETIELTKVFRQTDAITVKMLNALRGGEMTPELVDALERARDPARFKTHAIKLRPLRREARDENQRRLAEIDSPAVTYRAADGTVAPPPRSDVPGVVTTQNEILLLPLRDKHRKRIEDVQADEIATFKIGAEVGFAARRGVRFKVTRTLPYTLNPSNPPPQVILTRNISIESGLANGSSGVIIEFLTKKEAEQRYTIMTTPAYNDYPETAVERAADDQWRGINNPEQRIPVVRFHKSGKTFPIFPAAFIVNQDGYPLCYRMQIPLLLGYALTIHKSQVGFVHHGW